MRPPKKSETIEVRLPYPTKTAFIARCRAQDRTVSDAVRGFIETELGDRPRRRMTWPHIAAAALTGLAIGAAAAPSLAQSANLSNSSDRAVFQRLDTNGDGVLSFEEYRAR